MPLKFHRSLAVIVRVTLTYEANSSCFVGSSMNFWRKLAPSLLGRTPLRPFRLIQKSFLAVKVWLKLSAPWWARLCTRPLYQQKIQFPLQELVRPLKACLTRI